MWARFFAFAALILIILLIVQFSTLSDKDVEKIKSHIEAQKKLQQSSSDDEAITVSEMQTKSGVETTVDSILSEPPVVAYEAFLDAVPGMKFDSDVHQYLMLEAVDNFKSLFDGFASDFLDAFKTLHDFHDMEYMEVKYPDTDTAVITFIASSGIARKMNSVTEEDNKEPVLELFQVVMKNNADQWMIQREGAEQIYNPTAGIDSREKFRSLLEQYYAKRKKHRE